MGTVFYALGIFQLASIPVTLLATLPLLFLGGRFERRDSSIRVRAAVLAVVAAVTLAISIGAYVALNSASAGPLDDNDPFTGIARDAATLTAFHLAPLFVVLAVQTQRAVTSRSGPALRASSARD